MCVLDVPLYRDGIERLPVWSQSNAYPYKYVLYFECMLRLYVTVLFARFALMTCFGTLSVLCGWWILCVITDTLGSPILVCMWLMRLSFNVRFAEPRCVIRPNGTNSMLVTTIRCTVSYGWHRVFYDPFRSRFDPDGSDGLWYGLEGESYVGSD